MAISTEQKNKLAFDLMKIMYQMESLIQQVPTQLLSDMTPVQLATYLALEKQKSDMKNELYLLMRNDGDL